MENDSMKNKNVLITGAGQGMGLACAQKFLESGANVIINDIDSQRLDQVKKKLKDFDGCYKTIAKDISSIHSGNCFPASQLL